jgi:lysophospholipase L1-like esterase
LAWAKKLFNSKLKEEKSSFWRRIMNSMLNNRKSKNRINFIHAVLAALLVLSLSWTVSANQKQNNNPDPKRFKQEIERFIKWDTKNSFPEDSVLFVGSSSIRMWPTKLSFPNMKVINRGFGGSHISDVIYYSNQIVLPYKAKAIVFYAGDNDIAAGKTPQQVLKDYQKFVKIVYAKMPNTPIIFIAIKPSQSRWSVWPEMKKANSMIEDYCRDDKRLFYVDTAVKLLGKDGKPNEKMFLKDKLHLSEDGYKEWTSMLQPLITSTCSNTSEKCLSQ